MPISPYLGTTPTLGSGIFVHPSAQVIGDVTLGNDSSVWCNTVLRGDVNRIVIGRGTNVQDLTVGHVSHKTAEKPQGSPLIVGDYVTIGHSVILHGCTIGNECLIGMGSIILDDAVIPDRVIIGAGSLVTQGKALEPGMLYMGRPAKSVRAAAALAPQLAQVSIYQGLADLPHFTPDLEGRETAPVLDLRQQLIRADAVLIACPEYAHGLPGSFKNALDWVVGSGELVNKPVALLNLFERSTWAPALLRETLTMMTARIVEPASLTLGVPSNKVGEDFIMADARIAQSLRAALDALVQAIKDHKAGT